MRPELKTLVARLEFSLGFGWCAVADRELRPKLKTLVARIRVYPELRLVCSSRQRVEARVEDVGRPD